MEHHLALLARRRARQTPLCLFCGALCQGSSWIAGPFRRHGPFSTVSYFPATALGVASGHESIERPEPPQVYPLSGYYSDILSSPFPQAYRARSTRAAALPESPSSAASSASPQSSADKMSVVFGSRLAGPGSRHDPSTIPPESTWKTINGVRIPPRPAEPDNCCMSGCAHCVWDDFREDLESWAAGVQEARARVLSPVGRDTRQNRKPEVESASASMGDDRGGSETNWSAPSVADDGLFAGIPVGIREFMKTEKMLREKRHKEKGLA
jgi:Oxidoreductase-like protein, N-terminal